MKTPRKLTSLLLALLLVFALAATAAADGTVTNTNKGSITVDNPITGRTYTAYKIFDVVYEEPTTKNHYSYTIKDDSAWYPTVSGYATEANGLTLTPVADTTANTYVVTFDENKFSAPSFAATLKNALATANPTTDVYQLQEQSGKQVASGLPLGYYFVKSNANDALCNLTTTNPAVIIHDKNDMPFEKTDDKVSANVGETVNYTITGKVPDTTGFKEYTYEITDTMSEGLTFQKDVKVSIGTTEITAATVTNWINYTPAAESATGFKLTIPVKDYQNQVGTEIKITYSAVVNEKAVANIAKNQAVLRYSNDPTDSNQTTPKPPQEQEVYSSKIVINKYEKDAPSTKLPGAIFVLYKRGEGTEVQPTSGDYDTVTDNNGKTTYYSRSYYKYTDATATEGAKVEWVEAQAQATPQTTNDSGAASFDGLANGDYWLVETKAPAGYNQMTEAQKVVVKGGDTVEELSVTANVENQAGTLLPSTGGMGTTVFYVLGAVLVVGAGVLLVTKKRMSRNEG